MRVKRPTHAELTRMGIPRKKDGNRLGRRKRVYLLEKGTTNAYRTPSKAQR